MPIAYGSLSSKWKTVEFTERRQQRRPIFCQVRNNKDGPHHLSYVYYLIEFISTYFLTLHFYITGPSEVHPGSQTAGIIVPESSMSGTRGIARWNIGGSLDRVLSVMWSVPFNRQFWRQWVAVGLSSSRELPRCHFISDTHV